MDINKEDRVKPYLSNQDQNTMVLVTAEVASEAESQAVQAEIDRIRAGSGMVETLFDKFTGERRFPATIVAETKTRMREKFAMRRLNSFGATATEETLPEGWKALVFFPTTNIGYHRSDEFSKLRRTVPWAGVRDNGVLVSGTYAPTNPVMPVDEAFQEIAQAVDTGQNTIAINTRLNDFSLDGYANAWNWKRDSMDVTSNAIAGGQRSYNDYERAMAGTNDQDIFADANPWGFDIESDNSLLPSQRQQTPSGFTLTDPDTPTQPQDEEMDPFPQINTEYANFADYISVLGRTAKVTGTMFKEREAATFWKAQRALEAAMDPQALKLVRLARKPHSGYYNWLVGADRTALPKANILTDVYTLNPEEKAPPPLGADANLGTRRQQACTLFPLLAREWMYQTSSAGKTPILDTIDNGEELVPALAKQHRVSPRHIKAIRGLHWQRVGNHDPMRNPEIFLRSLPLDHMPTDKKGYDALKKCIVFVNDLVGLESEIANGYTQPAENTFTLPTHQKGRDLWEEIGPRHMAISKALGDYTPGGVTDMMRHMKSHLIDPILKNHAYEQAIEDAGMDDVSEKDGFYAGERVTRRGEGATICTDIANTMGVRQLADAQLRWHRNITAINDYTRDDRLPDTRKAWKGVLNEVSLGPTLVARELNSAQDLKTQGLRENHCVGGYTDQVLNNGPHANNVLIFSIEDTSTQPPKILSTASFSLVETPDGRKVSISQNYAKGNTTPSKQAEKAANAIKRKLTKAPVEAFQAHFASIQAIQNERKDITVTWDGATQEVPATWVSAGYDPRDRDRRVRAFEAFKPMLPKALAKSYDTFEAYVVKQTEMAKEKRKQARESDLWM